MVRNRLVLPLDGARFIVKTTESTHERNNGLRYACKSNLRVTEVDVDRTNTKHKLDKRAESKSSVNSIT